MKHLFFVAVAGGIFSGTTISVKAQTNASVEKLAGKIQPAITLRFIEGIEIVHEAATRAGAAQGENTSSTQAAVNRPSIATPAYIRSIELCSPLQFKYAMMMDREAESITNVSLYTFIESWWATRYQYGGEDRSGIDCSAFTGKLLSQVYGIAVPRTAKDQYNTCEKLAIENLAEGDLVFFNTRGGVSHVGLYLGNNYFVHSSLHNGVTISSLADEYYNRKFISGGRILQSTAPLTVAKLPGE